MKGNIAAPVLFLLLLLQLCFPSCPSEIRKINLGAVTGEETGGVFQLIVETRPGIGIIYSSISPKLGISTQVSEEDAVLYAFESAGVDRSGCDVFFRMDGNFGANNVDGPSAGAAMAIAVRAALLNKSIRQDIVMTGTITKDGRIGEIGGVIEKSVGVSGVNAKYFLVPSLKVHEAIMTSSLGNEMRFSTIEVKNISAAEEIVFSDYSMNFSTKFRPESRPMPKNLTPIKMDADLGRFVLVAKKIVDSLDSEVQNSGEGMRKTEDGARLYGYFSDEVEKYYHLLALGYPFTSANAAFLLSIDAHYAKIGAGGADLDSKAESVEGCVAGISPSEKTLRNFQWAIGGDLRKIWAKNKLNQTMENRVAQGGYTTLRDLFFAESWCGISKELYSQASDIGGQAAEESALASLASERLAEAQDTVGNSVKLDYDSLWHLENGIDANESGKYGAAIYEAVYAKTMQEIADNGVENVTSACEKLAEGGRKSLWGKIYYGQGVYLLAEAKENGAPPIDAYRILRYSLELDRASAEIEALLESGSQERMTDVPPPIVGQGNEKEIGPVGLAASALLAFSVFAFGLAIIYRLIKGGADIKVAREKIFVK